MTRIIPGQSQPFRALTGHLRKMSLPLIAALALAPIPADADEVDAGIAVLQTICASAEAAGKLPSALAKPALDGLDSKVMAQVKAAAVAVANAKRGVSALSAREKELIARLGGLNEKFRIISRDSENEKSLIRSKMQEIEGRKESLDAEIKTLTDQLNGKRQELGVEENKPLLDRTWGPAGKRINELQMDIAALQKNIAGKMGEKRPLAEEISSQQEALQRILGEWVAKVGPIYNELETVNSALENVMKELKAARNEEIKAVEWQATVEQAAGQARTCIQQARGGGQQRGDAGGEEIDYARIGKLGDEYHGSGENPADSQVVKKPVVPQGPYQGGAGGLVGKIPINVGSGILTPPIPQGSGVRQPGTGWQGLAPQGGTSGGGSGGGALPGPQVTSKPPAQLPPAAPTPKPPEWVAWEAGFSIGIHVSTEEEFQDTRPVKYTGGGPEPTVVKRNKLGGPFASQQAACEWIRPKLTNVRVRPLGIGRVGTFNGTEYYIGSMGCG